MRARSQRWRLGFGSAHPRTKLVILAYLITAGHMAWSQPLEHSQNSTENSTAPTDQIPLMPSALAQQSAQPTAAASAPNVDPQLGADYDYVDPAPGGGPGRTSQSKLPRALSTPRPPVSTDNGGLFYPLYGEPFQVGGGATPLSELTKLTGQPGAFAPPPQGFSGLGSQAWGESGEMGEQNEWLRKRLRNLRRFHGDSPAAGAQLEILQKQFPGLNLTRMYNSPALYGDDGYRGFLSQGRLGEDDAWRYGRGYGGGYGDRYGEGYGRGYGDRYGEGYGRGYGDRYGEGYGRGYGEGLGGYGGEDWYFYNGTWYPNSEFEDWYYHNGTWHRSLGDWEDGYFHNGTWYPGLDEMDEWYYHNGTWYPSLGDWEDGYFHNGTWYPGLEDLLEDGYFYNGTWYPGMGDLEDGYYYNGTWYPGYETEGVYEREEQEREEDLMWWQLHHPRWSGQDTPQQRPPYAQVPPLSYPNTGVPGASPQRPPISPHQQHLLLQQLQSRPRNPVTVAQATQHSGGNPFFNTLRNRQTPMPRPLPGREPGSVPGRPLALPVTQQAVPESTRQRFNSRRPPPPGYLPRDNRVAQRPGPRTARLTGERPPPPPFSRRRPPPNWTPPAPEHTIIDLPPAAGSNTNPTTLQAGVSGGVGEVKARPSSPLDPYRSTATVTVGIAIACFIGLLLIIAPLLCLLHKYRLEKRVKKRTFLRRAEHGSIDEGIMDAMVMSELGERRGSRVTRVGGKGGKTVWKGARPKTGKMADFPELQPLETLTRARSDRELADLYSTIP